MVTGIELFESSDLNSLDFIFGRSATFAKEMRIHKANCSIAPMDAAARITQREDQL
jgi:hypothetical protein